MIVCESDSMRLRYSHPSVCVVSILPCMFEQSRGVKRGRSQDSDPMLDRHGNAASTKLFVNKLPHNIKEQEINDLFGKLDGFVSIQLGNKVLMAVCILFVCFLPLDIQNDSIDLIIPPSLPYMMNDD